MSEAQELETPRVENDENKSTRPLSSAVEEENPKKLSNLESPEIPKTDYPRKTEEESHNEPNNTTPCNEKKDQEIVSPQSPTAKTLDRSKPGECNLLPVLVERLRSALEQSCSSQSSEDQSLPPEDSGVDSEEDLRAWASGLCSSMDQQRNDEAQSPRGLKLDLKFLEDLLLSDIQTALGRLQETLKRADIGTLTRYSSTLDPTNKLNLLKLISSLLANLKIPDEVKPEKVAQKQVSLARRRRADRHTIGVSSEELARARKWLEEKSLSPSVVEPSTEAPLPLAHIEGFDRTQESLAATLQENSSSNKEIPMERLEGDKQFDKVREKYMKDAINQQQSLQNRSKESQRDCNAFYEPPAPKLMDTSYKDDNTIINEEYGISASSLYHQSNAQAKCNKFLAKKSKIKRANTIDIPNYLKMQAESLANGQGGCVSLRRPINIGDKYLTNGGNVIPSFEPKTENDRKFLALINKNNEAAATSPSASLPFKSFNYRQAVTDKNWNSRFSNIKTTFDKPQDENTAPRSPNDGRRKSQSGEPGLVVGSLRLPYNGNRQKPGFSHAPTSPFQKIEKPIREETTPGFLKAGYMPKSGSLLQAKVKMFDQENVNPPAPITPARSKARQLDPRRGSNLFATPDESEVSSLNTRATENGHLNYHSFCKQFAPFASKNPADHKTNPWSSGNIVNTNSGKTNAREKFQGSGKTAQNFGEDNRTAPKVPVAYQAGNRYEKTENREKKEKPRHRKLYETYDGPGETNGSPRDVVAYPFEINYQKRPSFGKKFRDSAAEKGDYEDPEVLQQPRSPPPNLSSLQYIKSVLPAARNPSPPPRGIFSVQSVAVQTNQTEPPRTMYSKENTGFAPREENPRRPVPPPLPKEPFVQGRPLPEQPRRGSRQYDNLADAYQPPPPPLSPQRDDLPTFAEHKTNYTAQGRPQLPQSTAQESHYPPNADYKTQYFTATEPKQPYSLNSFGQTAPQVPLRSNPPHKVPSKNPQETSENYERYEKRSYDDFENPGRNREYQEYPTNFYHDSVSQNPIYVPPRQADRDAFQENHNPLPTIVSQPVSYCSDTYNTEEPRSIDDLESGDISEDHSFADDENIQNQDISSEGVVTRYACAIATVSSASESPAVSPLPPPLQEPLDGRPPRIFEGNLTSNQRDVPAYRDERQSEDLSLEEIRRHNLLQQNLIRQLQGDQSIVAKTARRLSQEAAYRDERMSDSPMNYPAKFPEDHTSREQSGVVKTARRLSQEAAYRGERMSVSPMNYPAKFPEDHTSREQSGVVKTARRLSQEAAYRDERMSVSPMNYPVKFPEDQVNREQSSVVKTAKRLSQEAAYRDERASVSPMNYPAKLPEDQNNEPVIESNNTQEKINIFEGRNNSMRKQQQQHFKPLSIPRVERESFVPPKINIVSPSKVFKPSFNADTRGAKNVPSKTQKSAKSHVDSSDEYLMSCANKPSRSIVLSKSESWHQLAMSKSTLQVPQTQPSLLKPPKPKSPSSLRLSKQYEASSSSDNIRKMEEKIQRYFQGPSATGLPDSPVAARRDTKTKRNFAARKSQGSLVRSHTMPHIYDETTDVEKAFDSLFKEATRTDNRY